MIEMTGEQWYNLNQKLCEEGISVKHIKTLNGATLKKSADAKKKK